MPEPRQFHRASTRVMSVIMVLIGIALLVRTLVAGGGALTIGIILGLLFIGAGAARLYLQFRAP
jgi:multisubunit Na+/H+ antiporter MnhB subunit